jgi:hypothetical protein
MRHRGRTAYCLSLPGSVRPIHGTIYNIFPEIEAVHGAYYFPIIDAIYQGNRNATADQWAEQWMHEQTHAVLAQSLVTCQQRELAFRLLAEIADFLTRPRKTGYRLRIPSFIIRQGKQHDPHLAVLADQLDGLFQATEMIQEIIAATLQVEMYGWSSPRAKAVERRMKQRLQLQNTVHQSTQLELVGKIVREFLQVYRHIGPEGAFQLGRYALNTLALTPETALERLRTAVQVAAGFAGADPREGGIDPAKRTQFAFQLVEYLDNHLPDYQLGACPLAGACLSQRLRESGQARRKAAPHAADIRLVGADMMDDLRCNPKAIFLPRDGLVPIEAMREAYTNAIEAMQRVGAEVTPAAELTFQDWPLIYLTLIDDQPDKHRVVALPLRADEALPESDQEMIRKLMALEALRQQMWHGDGPYCVCHPYPHDECMYRSLLKHVWEQTEPDPDWEASGWKQEDRKPQCI